MVKNRFLLIREIGAGLWNEMHHVLTQLLAAEIMQRIPVVYWGKGSLYASSENFNAFEQFFMPVSCYSVNDLAKEEFSFCPKRWNSANILMPAPGLSEEGRNTAEKEMHAAEEGQYAVETCMHATEEDGHAAETEMHAAKESGYVTENGRYAAKNGRHAVNAPLEECGADVCVRDTYVDAERIIPLIPKENPLFGLNRRDLFHRLIHKYIRLQEEAQAFIDDFYNENMKDGTFLAVHIRSSDKITEVRHLHELNGRYVPEIDKVLQENPGMRIFLMTDCIEILEEYKKRYGSDLVHTECGRVPMNGQGAHFQKYPDNRLKGFEIIRDTWLAARCDFFIGNGYSNVSAAISELKNWKNDRIKLLY